MTTQHKTTFQYPDNPPTNPDLSTISQTILNLLELGLPIPTKLTKLYNKQINK